MALPKTTVATKVNTSKKSSEPKFKNYDGIFLFDKTNYIIMAVGVAVSMLGFFLMAGGKSPNLNEFHPETLYSTTRVTIAPFLILLGFGIGIFAILRKPQQQIAE
jgi:Protein of unknown function (DUF3098)